MSRDITLTPEEVKRYAPYHTMAAFALGFCDYNSCHYQDLPGVDGQAYDRGAECAMRRGRGDGDTYDALVGAFKTAEL